MLEHARPDALELGQRVRARRKALGWSQEKLAERSGLSRGQVGFIEQGRRDLRLSTLRKVAAALEVDPGELIAGMTSPLH